MNDHEKEWDNVWAKKNLLSKIITSGRNFYDTYFIKLIKPYISKEKTFLEIGCGTSSLLLKISGYFKKGIGLDISSEALKISKKNVNRSGIKNVSFVKGDCLNLPFKNNILDVVWSQGLLEHFDNPEKVILEHYRVCKKKGVVIINVPYKFGVIYLYWLFTRISVLKALWPWTDQIFYTKRLFKKQMNALNLKDYNIKTNLILGQITLFIKKD